MNKDILNTGILSLSFLVLFGIAEILYHKFKVKAELTRKLVHFVTGILTLLFPILLDNHWLVLLLCGSFALILALSLKFGLIKSINAIDRESHGSISYPISVYGCYLAYNHYDNQLLFFYLPILTLAICDPLAALFGKRFPLGKFKIGNDTKTIVGCSAFFISSLILTITLLFLLSPDNFNLSHALIASLTIAAIATTTEAISGRGLDNITIPAIVLVTLIIFR
jgi:phytol kinase